MFSIRTGERRERGWFLVGQWNVVHNRLCTTFGFIRRTTMRLRPEATKLTVCQQRLYRIQ